MLPESYVTFSVKTTGALLFLGRIYTGIISGKETLSFSSFSYFKGITAFSFQIKLNIKFYRDCGLLLQTFFQQYLVIKKREG